MRPKKTKRWQVLAILFLTFNIFSSLWLTDTRPAFADTQSRVRATAVNPIDGNLWVVWYNPALAGQGRTAVSVFNTQGKLVKSTSFPAVNIQELGFVFLPGEVRYYFANISGVRATILGLGYYDLLQDKTVPTDTQGKLTTCNNTSLPLTYNPRLGHLYIPCYVNAAFLTANPKSQSLAVDVASNKLLGGLPYTPLGYSPANGQLYALRATLDPAIANSYRSDLITIDALNEQATPAVLYPALSGQSTFSSFNINNRSGLVYLWGLCFTGKCGWPEQLIFNVLGQRLTDVIYTAPLVERYSGLNEATNQLYGQRLASSIGDTIAISGNSPMEQKASFSWQVLAVDSNRNRVYGLDTRFISTDSPNKGLGILVMDGTNFDIIQYLPIQSPEYSLLTHAKPFDKAPEAFNGKFFYQTGHTLGGPFLTYWETHGGLAVFGYPITELFDEFNLDDGKVHRVQYFERNRFELHPENAGTQYEVLLGLLGKAFSARTGPDITANYGSGETSPVPGGLLFKETGHTLTGKFLDYWQAHGGLAIFGLPLTEPFQEVSPTDGQTRLVQYFERNRFELHPEKAGTEYEVLLGLLGIQVLQSRGWSV